MSLKPCPFCAGSGELHVCRESHPPRDRAFVLCGGCGAKGPIVDLTEAVGVAEGSPQERAVALWNTRDAVRGLSYSVRAMPIGPSW